MIKMKLWLAMSLLLLMLMSVVQARAEVEISAQSAALMEQSTGRVLWVRNGQTELPMASTTKIMTALCALESAEPDREILITKDMCGIEGSSIYLEEGEELSVEDLLYGLMLRSGNDAATALAIGIGGSVENFVRIMNDKATKLGLTHTLFRNPHGLPAEGHYTTAVELGKIACAAYENENFRTIVATQRKVIPWKGHPYDRAMVNKNKMLTDYPGGNGVKTGYTKAAGRCLVSGAERNGMQLIAVVLNAPDMWADSGALLDFGFENVRMKKIMERGDLVVKVPCAFGGPDVPLIAAGEAEIPLLEGEKADIRLEIPVMLESGVAQGEQIGYAYIGAGGEMLETVPLIAGETREPKKNLWQRLRGLFSR